MVAQGLIVIVVYALYILKAPPSTVGILGGAILLVLSAWIPVVLRFGSILAASATLMNVAARCVRLQGVHRPDRKLGSLDDGPQVGPADY